MTLLEECARVPVIVRVPGLTKDGTKSEALVELVDMFPTLVDLCGINSPNEDNNLASNPRFAEQCRQMHSLLTETRKSAESKRKQIKPRKK